MGFAKAMGAALFAEKITAKQADDWGMIWESVPDEQFAQQWWDRALHLAKGPTMAYGNAKKALYDAIILKFSPAREKFEILMKDENLLEEILCEGAKKATIVANETLKRVRNKLGFLNQD